MPSIRRLGARAASAVFGPFALARLARARGLRGIALNYHIVHAGPMRAQLDILEELFRIVPLEELLAIARSDRSFGDRVPVALTFDDGKRSHLTETAVALRERKVPATFFVTAGPSLHDAPHWFDLGHRVSDALDAALAGAVAPDRAHELRTRFTMLLRGGRVEFGRWKRMDAAQREAVLAELADELDVPQRPVDDDERPLSPQEILCLAREGFTIGSHSFTHPILTLESSDRVWHEVDDSRTRISEWIREPVRHFAYPNGNHSAETELATRKAGYATAWVTDPLWLGPGENLHRLPRLQVFPHYDRAEIALKVALATAGVLPNPDGTGRAYRTRRVRTP